MTLHYFQNNLKYDYTVHWFSLRDLHIALSANSYFIHQTLLEFPKNGIGLLESFSTEAVMA